ncbi:hypothetical protein RhiXN_12277 [Rhizoctonia solani]|uniref:Uncharacterized protein n=1 Tax=Rhizoctonia solani TaxID=456999 RepID=A0A8H8PA83_9AGAM|nr:uncharacterized protein RhiXN_12277 [Rhizoctonia solani]QRW26616.1 hypothetical protein RhiXN_12277 [Rhizoctonia solani]
MDESQLVASDRLKFFWAGCQEIIYNTGRYGLEPMVDPTILASIKTWCDDYLKHSEPLTFVDARGFVQAIIRVYDTVSMPPLNAIGTNVEHLPEAAYIIVAHVTCLSELAAHRSTCVGLLARFRFPQLGSKLLDYLIQIRVMGRSLIAQLGYDFAYGTARQSRNFSASQLWLLLHLADHSATENQKKLRLLLEKDSGLKLATKGVEQVKKDLEWRLLNFYKEDRLDTYSARIVECIHQLRRSQPDQTMATHMEGILQTVPKSCRGLAQFTHTTALDIAVITPLPPSRPISRSSTYSKPEVVLRFVGEPSSIGHSSIDITSYQPGFEDDWRSL